MHESSIAALPPPGASCAKAVFRALFVASVLASGFVATEPLVAQSTAPTAPAGPQTTPVPMPKAPMRATTVWSFSRSEIIDRLCERLRGASSLRAWRFCKEALARSCEDEEVQQAVIQFFEKSLLTKGEDAMARNAIEVMRRSKNVAFSPVLERATRHSMRTIREDALAGLESCGDPKSVARLTERFGERDLRSQVLVLRVLARRAPAETVVPFLRDLIEGQVTLRNLGELTASLLEIFQKQTPAEVVAGTLKGKLSLFPETAGDVAAKQLHESGVEEGRLELVRRLASQKDPKRRAAIVDALALRNAAASLEPVLEACAESKSPHVRAALARFLGSIGDRDAGAANAVAMLEVLSSDSVRVVEVEAMAALRGRSESSTARLLAALETANGSKLRSLIELLMRAPDARAVPIFVRRLSRAQGRDRQLFIQILGRMGLAEALPTLEAELRRPSTGFGRDADSIAYTAIVATNIPASEDMLWRLWRDLSPTDPQALAVRSHLLKTLANLAKAPGKGQKERLARIHGQFRDIVFDSKAVAAERLRCLDYLRGATLGIEDAVRLGRKIRRDESFAPEALAGSFNDYLHEFF